MVVKMMRWRPWPPLVSKKVEAKVVVKRLEGFCNSGGRDPAVEEKEKEERVRLTVEIRWKGPKIALSTFRRSVKRDFTKEEGVDENGVVSWEEEFSSVCNLSGFKDNVFHPWEVSFTLLNGLNVGPKNKALIIGSGSLNLAEFASASATDGKEFELSIPLAISGIAVEKQPSLCIRLWLLEMRTAPETAEPIQRPIAPNPSSLHTGEMSSSDKDEMSALKAGLKKVKIFTEFVSTRRAKKACREEEESEGRWSSRSEEGDYTYPFDSESHDESEEAESDEIKDDSTVRKSFSYGPLAYANCAGGSIHSNPRSNCDDENLVYYSNRRSDVGCSKLVDLTASISEPTVHNSKRSILPWKKRKLSFRSPKTKGEPLLKKDYGEEGGDDIDFDRRQLSSDESSFGWLKTDEDSSAHQSSVSEFGEDSFAIGSWEQKEITSRDGHMQLQTQVFFASIDQRSERAAGESACTALVAVIADWFQSNQNIMPIKSQFDSLIREGSLEWRNLCENETYRERFPDKHFDLETVLQAKVRPLALISEKSFIGFFRPDRMDEGRFDFLHGAMSFDNMWDEISSAGLDHGEPQVYIVSWNDHFFVLRVESEAYYIIDTLGERLYEGCNQAYILKFDRNTSICKLPCTPESMELKPTASEQQNLIASSMEPKSQPINSEEVSGSRALVTMPEETVKYENEEVVVCQGKESCKEYIKSFLAAIPIRELETDIKKGLMASTPLHQRLQIEIHYTQLQIPAPKRSDMELAMNKISACSPLVSSGVATADIST